MSQMHKGEGTPGMESASSEVRKPAGLSLAMGSASNESPWEKGKAKVMKHSTRGLRGILAELSSA